MLPTNGCLDFYLLVINEVRIQWHLKSFPVRLLVLNWNVPHQNSVCSYTPQAVIWSRVLLALCLIYYPFHFYSLSLGNPIYHQVQLPFSCWLKNISLLDADLFPSGQNKVVILFVTSLYLNEQLPLLAEFPYFPLPLSFFSIHWGVCVKVDQCMPVPNIAVEFIVCYKKQDKGMNSTAIFYWHWLLFPIF